MIIYPSGVYTFNGQIQEEDMQMFWVYSYKGFSRTAARTVRTALVLAGRQGCCQADTGHLLLALVQTARGSAADFLRRKRVTTTALANCSAARAEGAPRRLHRCDLAPELRKAMEFAVLGHMPPALPGPKMSICSALCLRIPPAQPAAGCFPLVSSCRRPRGSAASSRVSWYCPHSPGWQPAARGVPAKNTAAT